MTTFHVSLDALGDLVARLDALRGELDNAKGAAPGYAGQTGSGAVGGALDAFFADWSDGMRIIAANLETLAGKLSKTVDAYDGVECSLVQGMTGGAGAP